MFITLRPELPKDAPQIRKVNQKAFGQRTEAAIVDVLRERCHDSISFVATTDNRIVGHILFTPVMIQQGVKEIRGMGLAPMAVLPEYQRQGIGSAMVKTGIDALRKASCPFVVVLGHPEYYPRFGFVPAARHGIRCQWEGVPDEAFMAIIIDAPTMEGVSGVARYRAEFDQN